MYYINYFNHHLIQPFQINVRSDVILPSTDACIDSERSEIDDLPERIASIAKSVLPLLCLYQPLGYCVSLADGTGKVFSRLTYALLAIKEGKWSEGTKQMARTSLAVILVCSTFFKFKIGALLNNSQDAILSVHLAVQCVLKREYSKAGVAALHAAINLLSLGFMLTGGVQYQIAVLVIHGAISLYQAREELSAKRYPEALICLAMASIRGYQAWHCYEQFKIQRFFLSIKKCQELYERARKGKEVRDLLHSELMDIGGNIEKNRVILEGGEGEKYDFGAHFHAYGKGLVKGANLEFRKVSRDGKTFFELDFKINHYFRSQLEDSVNHFKELDSRQIQSILKTAHSQASDVVINEGTFPVGDHVIGSSHELNVKGLGNVIIGADSNYPGLYDRVIVQMAPSKNLFDLHELLALTGLDTALRASSLSDIERLKVGHLYRVFFPEEATPLERSSDFFSLPVNELKEAIIERSPAMKEIFDSHLNRMQKAEILPGKVRYQITGLADELRTQGARYLTATLTDRLIDKFYFKGLASVLKMGLISSEMRAFHKIVPNGYCPMRNFETGGADSVFTQMITDRHVSEYQNFDRFGLYSDCSFIRVVFSLEALETGTYQYHNDDFGIRIPNDSRYLNRPGIQDFVQVQNSTPSKNHEVMIKDRLPPSFIKALLVPNNEVKAAIIYDLRKENLVKIDSEGKETILGKPIDKFIQCTNNLMIDD